jgi:malate dehydrogenase (quinone)
MNVSRLYIVIIIRIRSMTSLFESITHNLTVSLRLFLPQARAADWQLAVAGQRVQIIKQVQGRGSLQMGTELVTSADGALAALLGASPGASTAVQTMLELLRRCMPERLASEAWQRRLQVLIPSWGVELGGDAARLAAVRERSDAVLGLASEG